VASPFLREGSAPASTFSCDIARAVSRSVDWTLAHGDLGAARLPTAVHAVGGRALRTAAGCDDPGGVALARVLSPLVASGSRRAAVIVEPAHPARITPLLMSAYGLTGREQGDEEGS
jgi:hypothetical protein